jgi:hypothetical protein
MKSICKKLIEHYATVWANHPIQRRWDKGPVLDLGPDFCVLEFSPTGATRTMWTYATCCMSQPEDADPIELHLFSPTQCDLHVELLAAIGHYHRTGQRVGLGHTINFGRPWMTGSCCDYGLISLPYMDGPAIENFHCLELERVVRCLWLIPITRAERDFKIANGLEALEKRFEEANVNYLDPMRLSLV